MLELSTFESLEILILRQETYFELFLTKSHPHNFFVLKPATRKFMNDPGRWDRMFFVKFKRYFNQFCLSC